jgi:hypothetical protein
MIWSEKGKDITVILNVYNRPYTLEKQIEAVKKQVIGIPDENIWIWYNKGKGEQPLPKNPKHRTFQCNENTKFHGRFAAAMLARTEYVALFDDDVIPGSYWFKNCLESMSTVEGIYGTTGVLLQGPTYQPNHKVGWNGYRNPTIQLVDLVGHAWFFKKKWLKYMWFEEPVTWDNGEDIMFSYLCQKYGKINTYVPPHVDGLFDQWGNDPSKDNGWGSDENATWLHTPTHFGLRDQVVKHCIDNGWKIVNR